MRMLLFVCVLLTLGTGTARAQADPCAGLNGYDYTHCSTAVEGDRIVRDYWASLTPRQKELTRLANAVVEEFRRENGRFPTNRDRRWGREVAALAGLRSEAEAQFLIAAMNSAIRGSRAMDDIGDEMCAAARMYSDMGFSDIYQGVMPECF
jgi:hypothetical protein